MGTPGLLLTVVPPARVQDRDGAKAVPPEVRGRLPVVFADGGYAGQLVGWVKRA